MRKQSRILDHIDPPAKRTIIVDKAKQLRAEAKELRANNTEIRKGIREVKAEIKPLAQRQRKAESQLAKNTKRLNRIKILLEK